MIRLLSLLCLIDLSAQTVENLGVMTDRRMIFLEKDTNRSDFSHFVVELKTLRYPSNYVTLVKTNDALTIEDFLAVGPGPVAMGVYSVCLDGSISPQSIFRLDVRRDSPSAPKARSVGILKPNYAHSLSNQLRLIQERPAQPPPIPGQTNRAMVMEPLPGGTNRSYERYMLEMQALMAQGKRRSE